MRKLSDLVSGQIALPAAVGALEISSITADSRKVVPGTMFAALTGIKYDGANFVTDAVAAGAIVILAAADSDIGHYQVPVLRVQDPRRELAIIASRFYGRQPDSIVAVTGTSGKSSVVEFVRQILSGAGRTAASLGTIGLCRFDGTVSCELTTPDPITLHAKLAELTDDGVTHLSFEASSHGLDQRRLDGVNLKAAAFTNFSRDHFDYHTTLEHYLSSKLRLFDKLLPEGKSLIVNSNSPEATRIAEIAQVRNHQLWRVGSDENATIKLDSVVSEGFAQRLKFIYDGTSYDIKLNLIGRHQVMNALIAAALVLALGEPTGAVMLALEKLTSVIGRLEVVEHVNGAIVVIDYAHKPEALASTLDALRPFVFGRLILVFGCGGDRDTGKRVVMGKIAEDKADIAIVTDDNPRTEDPHSIRSAILASVPNAIDIGDRHEAIATALDMAGSGDVILIAGKGHETGQIIGSRTIPFADHKTVAAIVRNLRRS
ncbi:MAG TPA: UDP-N-acetylmuramoyl-L-alanyl-D-glutamate--2,6-diaminopimelate ligase [Hyphomicrobiaceae bacterium MAG_BT-2024]